MLLWILNLGFAAGGAATVVGNQPIVLGAFQEINIVQNPYIGSS